MAIGTTIRRATAPGPWTPWRSWRRWCHSWTSRRLEPPSTLPLPQPTCRATPSPSSRCLGEWAWQMETGNSVSIDTFTFCSLLTVPPGAASAVAGRQASSSPQVSTRLASTRQCSTSGVFRAGRCVAGVDIAPSDEWRADVPEIRTFRRHPADGRQERQEGGEREQEVIEDDGRTVNRANASPFMPSYRRPAAPCRTSVPPSVRSCSRSPPSWRAWRLSAG